MEKNNRNLITINAVFVVSLIMANVVASKIVDVFGFVVPAAVVAYGITFLCTDIIGEIWGKEEANKTVKLGFVMQILSLCLIILAIMLPPAVFAVEEGKSFNSILGQSGRMVVASLIAYLVAQFNDVYVFHKLKAACNGKAKWIRNNGSTILSQFFDTAIFITVAFYGVVPDLGWMVISQYVVKVVIALCDTPFFYFFTRKDK